LATFHSFVNARYSDISIDRNDFDVGFLITFRKKYNFTLQKAMIFGQKITIIITTIIKHHNSKHIYIVYSSKLTINVCTPDTPIRRPRRGPSSTVQSAVSNC
jgi:hypothetical protein